jgi:hypothetical protein
MVGGRNASQIEREIGDTGFMADASDHGPW